MKKISILLIAVVLLAVTLPVMAQITTSGGITNKLIFQKNSVGSGLWYALNFGFKADDFASGTFNLANWAAKDTLANSAPVPVVDTAKFDLNVLNAFGLKDLPVDVTLTSGWFEWSDAQSGLVSQYAIEDVLHFRNKDWTIQPVVSIAKMVNVKFAVQPAYNGTEGLIKMLAAVYGTFGPVSAQVAYTTAKSSDTFGDIGFGAGVNLDKLVEGLVLKLGLDMAIQLPTSGDIPVAYGAGLGVSFKKLINFTAGFTGNVVGSVTTNAFKSLAFTASSTPIDLITVQAGTLLNFATGTVDNLGLLEAGVKFNLGKSTLGAGWSYKALNADSSSIADGWRTFVSGVPAAGEFGAFTIITSVGF